MGARQPEGGFRPRSELFPGAVNDPSGGFPEAGRCLSHNPEVIAGLQPGALGFSADAPEVSGAGGRPTHGAGEGAECVGKNPGHSIARIASYAFADPEAMML